MIIIAEHTIASNKLMEYEDRGYEIVNYYDKYTIAPGESVGFVLSKLRPTTIRQLDYLLYTKNHNVTIQYKGKNYKFLDLQEFKDSIIYFDYLEGQRLYREKLEQDKRMKLYYTTLEQLDLTEIPEDLDKVLETYAYMYEIDYTTETYQEVRYSYYDESQRQNVTGTKKVRRTDYEDLRSKLLAYVQIKFYLDNDLPYFREPIAIDYRQELMFDGLEFDENDTVYIGNENYLEDVAYKYAEDVL